MEENKYTELDNLFQNRIESETNKKSLWNTPPDSIFGMAMHIIEEEKRKKRRIFFLWMFGTLSLVLLISVAIFNTSRINKLDQEIDEIIDIHANAFVPKTSNYLNVIETDESNSIISREEKSEEGARFGAVAKTQDLTSIYIDHTELNSKFNFSQTDHSQDNHQHTEEPKLITSRDHVTTKEKLELTHDLNNQLITVKSLLEIKIPRMSFSRELGILSTVESNPAFNQNNVHSLTFALVGGLNYSSFSMSGGEGMSDILTKYNKWYLGFDFGVTVSQSITQKWGIEYQTNLQNINNKSLFNGIMLFDEEMLSTNANGEKTYNPEIGLDSPLGKINRSVQINMDNVDIHDQDHLTTISNISNQIYVISLSIAPKFTLIETQKINAFFKGGVGINYIAQMNQDMDTKIYHNENMLLEDRFTSTSMDKLQNLYGSAFLGTGIRYFITERIFIETQLNYARSLQSIRKNQDSQIIKTHFNNFGGALSIGYRF